MRKRISDWSPQKIFLGASLCIMTVTFIVILVCPQIANSLLVIGDGSFLHDFLEPVGWTQRGQYLYAQKPGPNYPPLVCMLFCLEGRVLEMLGGIDLSQLLSINIYAITIYMIQTIIFILMLNGILRKEAIHIQHPEIVAGLISFSYPAICYAIPVGNTIFLTAVLLIMANLWRDSKKAVLRELALLFIAIAAGIKIYPALFSLFYWREKRWKELFRLLIYGCLFFFLPFLFFNNVIGLIDFVRNLFVFQAGKSEGAYTTFVTIPGALGMLFGEQHWISLISSILFGGIAVVFAAVTQVRWKREFLVCSLLAVTFPGKNMYDLLYFVVPLITFLNERPGSWRGGDRWYALGYAFVFTILPVAHNTAYKYLILYVMLIALVLDIGIEVKRRLSSALSHNYNPYGH